MVGVWQQYGSSIAALGLGWWDALLISHEGIADALHEWRWEDWQMMSNGFFSTEPLSHLRLRHTSRMRQSQCKQGREKEA
jgi:hypothetical protein